MSERQPSERSVRRDELHPEEVGLPVHAMPGDKPITLLFAEQPSQATVIDDRAGGGRSKEFT
jgi:hypothetical protein